MEHVEFLNSSFVREARMSKKRYIFFLNVPVTSWQMVRAVSLARSE